MEWSNIWYDNYRLSPVLSDDDINLSYTDQITKIDQHGGFVKGITWDPAGKFLASQVQRKR